METGFVFRRRSEVTSDFASCPRGCRGNDCEWKKVFHRKEEINNMRLKKAAAWLLAAILFAVLPAAVSAKEFASKDYTLEVPDSMFVFTPDTSSNDPGWAQAGITDSMQKLKEYGDMKVVANLISEDGSLNILLCEREGNEATQVYNFGLLEETAQQELVDSLFKSQSEKIKVENGLYDHPQVPFFMIDVNGVIETESGEERAAHERLYGTIVNGYSLIMDCYYHDGEKELGEEQIALIEDIIDSVNFTNILEKPSTLLTTKDIVTLVLTLVALVVIIAAPFIYLSVRKRRDKKHKAELTEKLSEYRKTHGGEDTVSGTMQFANSTYCSKEFIHEFSLYHTFIKNLLPIATGILLSLATVAASFWFDMDWWVKLLAGAVAVYYGYKVFTSPTNFEKVQRRVYDRGVSKNAIYTFYDEAFRVSGIQSTSVYPYFQISDIRKNKNCLYLYYGPENAYIVDRSGFSAGTDEEFIRFIEEKTGKKF